MDANGPTTPERDTVQALTPSAEIPERERGGGDHDMPYEYHRPTHRWTHPFHPLQYARLLILRSKVVDGEVSEFSKN
ncbi:MAG TPA: hypothetical protein VIN09_11255 [Chloroflexota bacterium]